MQQVSPPAATRTTQIGLKYRIYPEEEQKNFLSRSFGHCRFVFNWALDKKQTAYKQQKQTLSKYALMKELTLLKKQEEFEWLYEVNAQSLQTAIENLDAAYQGFFKKRSKFPKFKKRSNRQSFKIKQDFQVDEENGLLFIPKLKSGIPIVLHRPLQGRSISCTISKTPSGEYYASICCEIILSEKSPVLRVSRDEIRGFDAGLISLLTAKDGEVFINEKRYRAAEKKLKYLQRQLSKKKKGGSNRKKARQKVAAEYQSISNSRKNDLHQISRSIIDENQVIICETLKVANLMRSKLGKAFGDAAIGELFRQLEYKADWAGKIFHQVSQWFASSKTCFKCKEKVEELPLHIREWDCPSCGNHNHRDANAAANIEEEGIRELLNLELIEIIDRPRCVLGNKSHPKQKPAEPQKLDGDNLSVQAPEKDMGRKPQLAAVSALKKISGSMKQEALTKSS